MQAIEQLRAWLQAGHRQAAPSLPGVPVLGHMPLMWRAGELAVFGRAADELGPVSEFRFGPWTYVLVSDAEAARRVLIANAANYRRSPTYRALALLLGQGLLTADGELWRRQRRLMQPAFHKRRIAGLCDTMVGCTRDLVARWTHDPAPARRDLHREMMALTLRIAGLTLFSIDLERDAAATGRALDTALAFADDWVRFPLHLPLWVPTPRQLEFQRAMRELDGVVGKIIAARRRAAEPGDDLLGMLMAAVSEDDGATMDDRQLRDEVMTLVLAGHETTANLLTWALVCLARAPQITRALVDELRAVVGTGPVSVDHLSALPLLDRVVHETLRLYPPAWIYERQAIAPDRLGGYDVPADAIVGVCTYYLHRNPAYWRQPEGFDPDRFDESRHDKPAPGSFLPFGAGPRMCIGSAFALMEAKAVLAELLRAIDFELIPGHPIVPDPAVTLRPRDGVLATVRPRGD